MGVFSPEGQAVFMAVRLRGRGRGSLLSGQSPAADSSQLASWQGNQDVFMRVGQWPASHNVYMRVGKETERCYGLVARDCIGGGERRVLQSELLPSGRRSL